MRGSLLDAGPQTAPWQQVERSKGRLQPVHLLLSGPADDGSHLAWMQPQQIMRAKALGVATEQWAPAAATAAHQHFSGPADECSHLARRRAPL